MSLYLSRRTCVLIYDYLNLMIFIVCVISSYFFFASCVKTITAYWENQYQIGNSLRFFQDAKSDSRNDLNQKVEN
jgi:hypothetical protein